MKPHTYCPGNTLTEYALILGLVLVASIGALSLFGGSVSGLFDENSRHIEEKTSNTMAWTDKTGKKTDPGAEPEGWEKQIQNLISQFIGHSGASEATQSPKGNLGQVPSELTSDKTLVLTGSNALGTNTTSADGNTRQLTPERRLTESLALISKIEQIASQMPEGPDKQWFTDAARKGLLLAGTEATDEVVKKGNTAALLVALADKKLNGNDVGFNIQTFKTQVQDKLANMPASMSVSQKELGTKLITSLLDKLNVGEYETTYNSTVGVKTYSKSPEEVKKASLSTLAEKNITSGSTAVEGTVTNALTLEALGK